MKKPPARKLVYEDRVSGKKLELELFHCDERCDQYRVTLNGQKWLTRAGMSAILAALRKAIGRGGLS